MNLVDGPGIKTLFDPSPDLRWLFCMTHPDDEISVSAWIRRLTQAGAEVHLSWTHSTPTREAEARRGAGKLGVPQDRLYFFGATDGSVCDEIDSLLPRFRALMAQVQPARVVCGAFEQGHLDHDATNYLVNQTFSGPILEIPFYHTYLARLQTMGRFSDPTNEEILTLSPEEARFEKDFAKGFPSQNIWRVLLSYEIWQLLRGRPVELAKSDRMRLQTHRDFRTPNHPAALRAKVEASASWRRWVTALGDR